MYTKEYLEQGYVVIPHVIEKEVATKLSGSVLNDVFRMVYKDEPVLPSQNDPESLRMLADYKLRKKRLRNPECVWTQGDSRRPILAKNSGMINICYNPDVREHVHFNPAVYHHIADLYNTPNVAYIHGPGKVSVKVEGSTEMPLHLDHNLFYRTRRVGADGRFDERVQAFVCGSIPKDVPLHHSGTIELLPYFHHYFKLAREFFHPKRGMIPLRNQRAGLHKLGKHFEKHLCEFNLFVREYTPVYHAIQAGIPQEKIEARKEVLQFALKHNIEVPKQVYPLSLTPVECNPGDMVCFNQKIPHRNLQNQSQTPRIVFYVRLFMVPENWYGSQEHSQLLAQIRQEVPKEKLLHERKKSLERRMFVRDETFVCSDPYTQELAEKLQTIRPF